MRASWVLTIVLERGDTYLLSCYLTGPLNDLNLHRPSLISLLRETSCSNSSAVRKNGSKIISIQIRKKVGMHTSSSTTTPFSVEDILKHHHDFGTEFLMTEQVVPMHHPHMHDESRTRNLYNCQAELAGMQEKVDTHNSAAEEEINERGEKIHTAKSNYSHFILAAGVWLC